MILLPATPMKCHICGRGQLPTDGLLPNGAVRGNYGWSAYQWTCRHEVTFTCPDCKPGDVSCSQCGTTEAYC